MVVWLLFFWIFIIEILNSDHFMVEPYKTKAEKLDPAVHVESPFHEKPSYPRIGFLWISTDSYQSAQLPKHKSKHNHRKSYCTQC